MTHDVRTLEAAAFAYATAVPEDELVKHLRDLLERFCAPEVRSKLEVAVLLAQGCFGKRMHPGAARALLAGALYQATRYAPCAREREEALDLLTPHLPG